MIPDRILDRVLVTETCWLWTGALKHGYSWAGINGKSDYLHRHFYVELRQEIPEGLQIDHLCRERSCLNPWHMEPVTQAVNMLRGEAPTMKAHRANVCGKGLHSLDNAYVNPKTGWRRCRECARDYTREWRRQNDQADRERV